MPVQRTFRVTLLAAALLAVSNAAAERTYKWVDEDGVVHYSNRVPPEAIRMERKEINEHGYVVKVHEAPKTEAEKAEEKHQAELKKQQEEIARKRAKHDRSLMATYTSVGDMIQARDGKIATVEALIQLTNSRIKSMQERLVKLTEEAARYERGGKPLPLSLNNQINNLREQIAHNTRFAASKADEIESIKQQFSVDIGRFEDLTRQHEKTVAKGSDRQHQASMSKRDEKLLASFRTEEDLHVARDEELNEIDLVIQQVNERKDAMQHRLDGLQDDAGKYRTSGKPVPDYLEKNIEQLVSDISGLEQELRKNTDEKQRIDARFSEDIKRYRYLTASK